MVLFCVLQTLYSSDCLQDMDRVFRRCWWEGMGGIQVLGRFILKGS
jgi:hypothetical protein